MSLNTSYKVELLRDNIFGFRENGDAVIEASSMSYQKPVKTERKKFLLFLLNNGHHSCFEHTDFVVEIKLGSIMNLNDIQHINLKDRFGNLGLLLFSDFNVNSYVFSGSLRDFIDFHNYFFKKKESGYLFSKNRKFNRILDSINNFIVDFFDQSDSYEGDGYSIISWDDLGFDTFNKRVQFKFRSSRYTMDQLRTHRSLSFIAESQRRVSYSDDFRVVLPEMKYLKDHKNVNDLLDSAMEYSHNTYSQLRKFKVKKEDARCVLPMCIVSNYIVTASLKDWCDFIRKRMIPETQKELKTIASGVDNILKEVFKI